MIARGTIDCTRHCVVLVCNLTRAPNIKLDINIYDLQLFAGLGFWFYLPQNNNDNDNNTVAPTFWPSHEQEHLHRTRGLECGILTVVIVSAAAIMSARPWSTMWASKSDSMGLIPSTVRSIRLNISRSSTEGTERVGNSQQWAGIGSVPNATMSAALMKNVHPWM